MFDHFTTLCMGGLSGNKISVFFFYLLESSDKVYKLWSSLNAILENHFIEIDSSIMTNYPIKKKKKIVIICWLWIDIYLPVVLNDVF